MIKFKFGIPCWPQSPDIEKRNCHKSRNSDETDMKLGLVTKLDNRNKTMSKKLTMTACQKIVTSLLFFQFTASLEQSRRQISDA